MEWLPEIVATDGSLVLPLGAGTARRLAAALVSGGACCADRILLAEALARDPALTLWTVIRAHRHGATELRTIDSLAGWLARAILDQWSRTADDGRSLSAPRQDGGDANTTWAALAARSLGIATLAGQIARTRGLDEDAAYCLGLLHVAWQGCMASGGGLRNPPPDVLPSWLRDQLDRVAGDPSDHSASLPGCVRAAVQGAEADDSAALSDGIVVDQPAHAARLAAVHEDWLVGADAGFLANLIVRLRRLHDLENSFSRTLEAEKLESLKELAYGAGHEINNPLANISARAQTLLRDETDPQRRRMLASINAQAFRAHEMIADMMLFARPPAAKPESFDLVDLLGRLHAELVETADQQQTQIVLHAPRVPVPVVADKTQIAVALRSLCVNALEALVTGGRVEVALSQPVAADESVRIRVSDNGPGIPPEVRPHIFDPYYSGREAGRGLGLGLSKCWRIVTMHQGRVDVESPDGRGAVFIVTLPGGNAR